MNIIVLLKMVPDVVEELEITPDEKSLDTEWLRMILNETSNHALEQALLLKERYGGTVTVVSLDAPEVDDAFFTGLAKGADRAVKLVGDTIDIRSSSEAHVFATFIKDELQNLNHDMLIFTGSQAIDDLEGEMGPQLANMLDLPYIGVVTGMKIDQDIGKATVIKEFAGGLRGEFELSLPAVFGIQAAEKPPRYIPVAKIMAAMRSGQIDEVEFTLPDLIKNLTIDRMFKPETTAKAEMLEGTPDDISAQIADILAERGLI